jgi:hypothetical protein
MLDIFDQKRAILLDAPEVPPLQVHDYLPLNQLLAKHTLAPTEQMLVARIGSATIAVPMLSMVYHHIVQGCFGDQPWIATFCCLCNGGAVFSPILHEHLHTFAGQGYYDAMVLLADQQTGSYWNHLTGICLYGPLAGAALPRLGTLEQASAAQAVARYPHALAAVTAKMREDERATALKWDATYRQAAEPALDDELLTTLSTFDTRLPRYEMGLGLWTQGTQRFYPISRLYEQQNVILDRVDGRRVVILFNDTVGLPMAFYLETEAVHVQPDRIRFSNGAFYQNDGLYVQGKRVTPDAPPHAAIRWYGFSSIFPGCAIYRPR